MDNAKTEDEKIQALLHGEDAMWSEKKKELSLYVLATLVVIAMLTLPVPKQSHLEANHSQANRTKHPLDTSAIGATCPDTSKSSAPLSTTPTLSPNHAP